MRGKTMGPWIADASLHVADHTDRVIAQILVNENTAAGALFARPFVTDIRVDPAMSGHGIGTALLAASSRTPADLGWHTLTLVVTVGSPAQRMYERSGFHVTSESWRIETAR